MNNELPVITVITVTKNRPYLLERAIKTEIGRAHV